MNTRPCRPGLKDYIMPVMEEISKLSKNDCDDALLDYICENYDEIECELNVNRT